MEIIRSPHDKFFGRVLSVKKNAVSLLRNILPESLQKHLVIEDISRVYGFSGNRDALSLQHPG